MFSTSNWVGLLETFKEFYELVVPVPVVVVIAVVVVDPFQMDYRTCINSLNASLPPIRIRIRIRAFGSVAKRFMDLSFSYLWPQLLLYPVGDKKN